VHNLPKLAKKMTFKEVYNRTIKYYPSEIDISDGKTVEKNSGNFKTLSESWDNAELKAENESDFIKLMVWGIFCAYHKKAIDNFLNGKKTVSLTELDMEYLKYKFEESLLDTEFDNYAELRTEYKTE
jgi:phage terminase large subunit-like protein